MKTIHVYFIQFVRRVKTTICIIELDSKKSIVCFMFFILPYSKYADKIYFYCFQLLYNNFKYICIKTLASRIHLRITLGFIHSFPKKRNFLCKRIKIYRRFCLFHYLFSVVLKIPHKNLAKTPVKIHKLHKELN